MVDRCPHRSEAAKYEGWCVRKKMVQRLCVRDGRSLSLQVLSRRGGGFERVKKMKQSQIPIAAAGGCVSWQWSDGGGFGMKERKRRENGSWCEKMGVVAQALPEFLVTTFWQAAATVRMAMMANFGGGNCGMKMEGEKEFGLGFWLCEGERVMRWLVSIGDLS